MTYRKKKHVPTIRKIPDDLWDEIKLIFPSEKLDKTVGRPIVPFLLEKYLTVYSLRLKNGMSVENAS